ncbi:MAG: MFS transporter [Bacteroidia bacterium]
MEKTSKKILPIIVLAQVFCSSSWFAVNAIIENVGANIGASSHFLANATITIQLGFIIGTLVFAIFSFADRFSPSKVFFISSLLVCLFNLVLILPSIGIIEVMSSRFVVGFFLAGIYPVGMKIAADYFDKGLGKSLGFLVGALVLGTAFPHFIKRFVLGLSWEYVIYGTSLLTFLGGITLILNVPDGPFKKKGQKLEVKRLFDGFKNEHFKSAAFGYFGHMWELYTFWAFVPIMLKSHFEYLQVENNNISLISFFIIASGSISCVIGGYLSQHFQEKKLATISLFLSCLCCLLSPFFLYSNSSNLTIAFLVFWGMMVIADSPLFSTLVARFAPAETKGTALTLVNCIGFTITIISIKSISFLAEVVAPQYLYTLLCIGPIFGLINLIKQAKKSA